VERRIDLDFAPIVATGFTIEDVWKNFMRTAMAQGRKYTVDKGSHAGDYRLTLDCAIGYIRHPEIRPLAPLVTPGRIPPTDEKSIEEYFQTKVFSDQSPAPNEHYNYSEWLYPLSLAVIEYYSKFGFGSAHATMRVGDPLCFLDYFQPDVFITDASQKRHMDETKRPTTPCLLGIDTKIVSAPEEVGPGEFWKEETRPHFLTFYVMYRSWDLFGGFPENMGGFQLLKERIASEISAMSGKNVKPGPSMVFCKDLHLYGSRVEAAKAWLE